MLHACKILNASGKNVFVTAFQLSANASAVDHARDDGLNLIVVPDKIYAELAGARDIAGEPVRNLEVYQQQWNDSFKFKWISAEKLSAAERKIFDHKEHIVALAGGLPGHVKQIRISETMRMDFGTGTDAAGLWDPESSSIVIRRDQLKALHSFAGTLLHEVAHAKSGYGDVTRGFENELTELLGSAAAAAIAEKEGKRPFWRR